MAHFYGLVSNGRGEASRTGTKKGGLSLTAASSSGSVRTHLYVNEKGVDCAVVTIESWQGRGPQDPIVIFNGPINPLGLSAA